MSSLFALATECNWSERRRIRCAHRDKRARASRRKLGPNFLNNNDDSASARLQAASRHSRLGSQLMRLNLASARVHTSAPDQPARRWASGSTIIIIIVATSAVLQDKLLKNENRGPGAREIWAGDKSVAPSEGQRPRRRRRQNGHFTMAFAPITSSVNCGPDCRRSDGQRGAAAASELWLLGIELLWPQTQMHSSWWCGRECGARRR